MNKSYVNGFIEEEIDCNQSKNQHKNESTLLENDCAENKHKDDNDSVDDFEEETVDHQEEDINQPTKKLKKRKKGIIYVSNLPKHMNVTRIREILGQYGKIGRIYLQPEKLPENQKNRKKKRLGRHFTEGWVEFESKRVAKKIVEFLNNQQISTRKRSQFYDCLWSMKYLPRFKWVHLTERLNYEQAVYKQRLRNEVSQARKQATFFQNNLDKSEKLKKNYKKQKSVK